MRVGHWNKTFFSNWRKSNVLYGASLLVLMYWQHNTSCHMYDKHINVILEIFVAKFFLSIAMFTKFDAACKLKLIHILLDQSCDHWQIIFYMKNWNSKKLHGKIYTIMGQTCSLELAAVLVPNEWLSIHRKPQLLSYFLPSTEEIGHASQHVIIDTLYQMFNQSFTS